MIEVIYKGDEKKEKKQLELPKNIRQVGEGGENLKIYIEDYVITYMNQLTEKMEEEPVTAILLGEINKREGCCYIFINGVLDVEHTDFDEKMWEEIHLEIDRFFPKRQIVGWFRGEEESELMVSDNLTRIHLNQFPKEEQVLILRDAEEKESAIFTFESGKPTLQKGYYIYFDKNTQMQEYMVSKNGGKSVEHEKTIKDEAIQSFRKITGEKKEESQKKPLATRLLYAASSLLLLTVLIAGVTMVNNYDKMKKMELTLVGLSESLNAKNNNGETEAMAVMANAKQTEGMTNTESESQLESETASEAASAEAAKETQAVTEAAAAETEPVETEAESTKTANAAIERNGQASYIIKEGDTLATISEKYYGSMDRVDDICNVNDITDKNHILPGQKIVLP